MHILQHYSKFAFVFRKDISYFAIYHLPVNNSNPPIIPKLE